MDESTDDAIDEGGRKPTPKASRTSIHGPGTALDLAKLLLAALLQVAAFLIAFWASVQSFFAYMFRFDDSEEFEWVKQFDVEIGGVFALAVVLFFGPACIKKPRKCILLLGVAALVWLFVTWSLLAHHEWVDRVRSGLSLSTLSPRTNG